MGNQVARATKVRLQPGQSVELCDIDGCVEVISAVVDPDPTESGDRVSPISLAPVPPRDKDILPPNTVTPVWVTDSGGNRRVVLVRTDTPSAGSTKPLPLPTRLGDFVTRHGMAVAEPVDEHETHYLLNAAKGVGAVDVYAAGPRVSVGAVETLRVGAEEAGLDLYMNILS